MFAPFLLFYTSIAEDVKIQSVDSFRNSELFTYDPDSTNKNYVEPVVLVPAQVLYENPQTSTVVPASTTTPTKSLELHSLAAGNPLLAALLLSQSLGITPKSPGFNHAQHLPTNPYVALLLSHYGKYVPAHGYPRGIYGYTAANNYHNNLPFGAYKVYEDRDS